MWLIFGIWFFSKEFFSWLAVHSEPARGAQMVDRVHSGHLHFRNKPIQFYERLKHNLPHSTEKKKVESTLQRIFVHILKQKKSLFQRFLFHKQSIIMYVLWPYLNIKIPVFEKTCTKAFFFNFLFRKKNKIRKKKSKSPPNLK